MKRAGNLWGEVTSFANLLEAARRAALGKRRRRDVAAFELNREWELLRLQRELLDGSYQPGEYRSFQVRDPKPRRISAAPYRDRVVHHALTQIVEPIFERRFSKDSFACRKRMGTHAALKRARAGMARYKYVLKVDVRKYFASIDHALLKGMLERVVKCRPTLGLSARIIDGSNEQEPAIAYYPGDDLFTPYERRRGLPLGNQTSQFFANVYLNGLDQMVNRELGPGVYARYVDDLVLFDDCKRRMREMNERIREALWSVRLEPHTGKSRIHRAAEGVTFLGFRLFPDHARLARGNAVRFGRRLRRKRAAWARGELAWSKVSESVRAWIAHAAHGDTWQLRRGLLERFAFPAQGARS